MREIKADFRPRVAPSRWAWWAVVTLWLPTLWIGWRAWDADLANNANAKAAVELDARDFGSSPGQAEPKSAYDASAQAMMRESGFNLGAVLTVLETTLPKHVRVDGLTAQPAEQRVHVQVQAETLPAMLTFIDALGDELSTEQFGLQLNTITVDPNSKATSARLTISGPAPISSGRQGPDARTSASARPGYR